MASRPPLSPPPLTRSRRSSLTFSPSALERFRLPEAPPAIPSSSVRRSARLQKQKKASPPESSPKKKKARTETSCCTICMGVPKRSELANIDGCCHTFCFDCIQEWSDRENSCPNCKVRFRKIIPNEGHSVSVAPRNQTNDMLETMLGQLAASHQHWQVTAVPDTLQSLRLALTLQARSAAMRVIHTTTTQHHTSIRLQGFLRSHHHHHHVIGSFNHPIVLDDDEDEVQLVE